MGCLLASLHWSSDIRHYNGGLQWLHSADEVAVNWLEGTAVKKQQQPFYSHCTGQPVLPSTSN